MDPSGPTPARDRAATEARILEAALGILTEQGSAGLGVNAVARAAGVDKQLIYRYYGGLDGLMEAVGERLALWWRERLSTDAGEPAPARYADLVERLAIRLLTVMRTEPLGAQSVFWELTDTTGMARPFAAARTRVLGGWLAARRGDLPPPPGLDVAALNAVIVAAISHLVLAARAADTVVGLPVAAPDTWDRLEGALVRLIRGAYGEPA